MRQINNFVCNAISSKISAFLTITSGLTFWYTISLNHAHAIDITLNFNSLPTSQGWHYNALNSNLTEVQVSSVNGQILYMNTMGNGFQGQGHNYYSYSEELVNTEQTFSLETRFRLTNEESLSGIRPAFGIGIGVGLYEYFVAVDFSDNTVLYLNETPILPESFDVSQFHVYSLQSSGNGVVSLLIDNQFVGTINQAPYSNYSLAFGDPTGGTNISAEITSFEFSQPKTVPLESDGLPILISGGFIYAGLLIKRRKKDSGSSVQGQKMESLVKIRGAQRKIRKSTTQKVTAGAK